MELWRWLLFLLRLRLYTPAPFAKVPSRTSWIDPLDTGGAYRPKHRQQDPAVDPREPYGGESSSRGQDHGWSGCTMTSGADAFAYATVGKETPWGGDMRHAPGQPDMDGGTDLTDLRAAFEGKGQTLTIKSGAGWGAVVDAHEAGRAIVIQGTGEVPGAGDFDGGHACCIGTETRASDGAWLFGDPLVSDWQWIAPGAIKSWAQRWSSSIAFAVTKAAPAPAPEPEPAPKPPPCPECPDPAPVVAKGIGVAADRLVTAWAAWLRAPQAQPPDHWDMGTWSDPAAHLTRLLRVDPCPPEPAWAAAWARGPVPYPVPDAMAVAGSTPAWGVSSWRAAPWG